MVSFSMAMFWLRTGEKVTRPCWKEDSYWEMGTDEIIFWNGKEVKATIHLNQIEANDWEVYREKTPPSLSDEICEGHQFKHLHMSPVKSFVKVVEAIIVGGSMSKGERIEKLRKAAGKEFV